MKLIKVLLITCLIFSGSPEGIFAQTLCFDAVKTRGCAPFTVNLINCAVGVPDSSILYNFNWNPGDPINGTSDTFFTYTSPGIYNILQIGNVSGSGDTLVRYDYIEVLPSPDPVYQVSRCDSNRVVVSITDNQYEQYFIDWGDGSFDTIAGLSQASHKYLVSGTKNIAITGNYVPGDCGATVSFQTTTIDLIPRPLMADFRFTSDAPDSAFFDFNTTESAIYDIEVSRDTLGSFLNIGTFTSAGSPFIYADTTVPGYCYRVRARDVCLNEKESEIICTVKLSAAAENNRNVITWEPYPLPINITNWELTKNSGLFGNFTPEPDSIYIVIDSQVICNEIYCYRLEASLFGGVSSLSNEVCVRGLSLDTPDALERFNVSIENDLTLLSWDADTLADTYYVQRGFTRVNPFDSTTASNYQLEGPEQDQPRICYAVDFKDACGNRSLITRINCPVEISVELNQDESRTVSWLAYEGWRGGVERYFVQKLDESGNVYFSQEVNGQTLEFIDTGIDTVLQNLRYRIKAESGAPDSLESYSLIYEIEQNFRLYFPNAFSPNDDGLNDIFEPIGVFAEEYELLIFNRWGELIFVSRDYRKGWDGKVNERDAPEGVYVFKVNARDELGRSFSTKSTLTLTR